MKITNHISDLLYRYECVIIPDFGGFISNEKPAWLNAKTNTFYPPFKALSFNANLKQNDGLLVNYIAKAEGCTYQDAIEGIKKTIAVWQNNLNKNKSITLDKIGSLQLNSQGKIVFEPSYGVNYLTTSYGLSPVVSSQIAKIQDQPVIGLNNLARPWLKYAAVFVLGLSTIGFGNKFYNDYQTNQLAEFNLSQQKVIQQKIQSATFNIANPLPSITLKNTYQPKQFHVVAGAFREPNNAVKKLNQLKKQGFDAAIIGKNKWELTQVVFGSYASKSEAIAMLRKVRAGQSPDAWLLIQKQ